MIFLGLQPAGPMSDPVGGDKGQASDSSSPRANLRLRPLSTVRSSCLRLRISEPEVELRKLLVLKEKVVQMLEQKEKDRLL